MTSTYCGEMCAIPNGPSRPWFASCGSRIYGTGWDIFGGDGTDTFAKDAADRSAGDYRRCRCGQISPVVCDDGRQPAPDRSLPLGCRYNTWAGDEPVSNRAAIYASTVAGVRDGRDSVGPDKEAMSDTNGKRLKVCLVAPYPPPYGGIAHWTKLILQYADARCDVQLKLVNTAVRGRAVYDLAVWKRVVFGGLGMGLQVTQVLCRILMGCRIVHLTTSGQLGVYRDLAIMKMARFFGVAVLYHIHFGKIPKLMVSKPTEWRRISRAMRQSTCVITIDAKSTEAIRRHLPGVQVLNIPNCVPVPQSEQRQSNNGNARVVYVGSVIPAKGVPELIRAWAELSPPDWRLLIVGPGDPAFCDELRKSCRSANVEFLGEKPHGEAMRIMAASEILVLPSHTEGFPYVVLEAMVLGKPVIATRVGAIPEMLEDDCGCLVEPQDVAGLKMALSRLMADGDLRRRLGRKANERVVARYSLDAVFSEYAELWRHAADRA